MLQRLRLCSFTGITSKREVKIYGAAETFVCFRLSQASGEAGELWSLVFNSEASAEVHLIVPSVPGVVPDLRVVLPALLASGVMRHGWVYRIIT